MSNLLFTLQEDPVNQILAYCCQHNRLQYLDRSIGCCFENCAIEAVTAACQVLFSLRAGKAFLFSKKSSVGMHVAMEEVLATFS